MKNRRRRDRCEREKVIYERERKEVKREVNIMGIKKDTESELK